MLLRDGNALNVRVPARQVEDGLVICARERKVWRTTGLPEPEMVEVDPRRVAEVRSSSWEPTVRWPWFGHGH
jgi:hypothetical protein